MTTIENKLQERTANAVNTLFGTAVGADEVQIQPTRKEFEGEFTVVVFPFVKMARKSPEQTGEMIGRFIADEWTDVESYSVVKGFLNFKMSSGFWVRQLSTTLGTPNYGFQPAHSKSLIMVEYSSPNTNKPLHLGHLRNIFLGYSVSQILEAYGHEVKRVQIINDRGIHICKSMVAWQKFGEGETPSSTGMKGDRSRKREPTFVACSTLE